PGSTRSGPGSRPHVRCVPWWLRDLYVRLQPRIADRTDGTIRARHRPLSAAAATPRSEAGTRRGAEPMTTAGGLADPRVRLRARGTGLLVTALAVHRDRVGPGEAAVFRAVNGLPGSLYRPAWALMQLGALGA